MRNLWAKTKPEDVVQREHGNGVGMSATLLSDTSIYNYAAVRKRLAQDSPVIVGRWNLMWLVHPDLDTYFEDASCRDAEGLMKPKHTWERLLLATTLKSDSTQFEGRPLWATAAETTPMEFVSRVFPAPQNEGRWLSSLLGGELDAWYRKDDTANDHMGVLGKIAGIVDGDIKQNAQDFIGWIHEARERVVRWTPPSEVRSPSPNQQGNVVHVKFGRS